MEARGEREPCDSSTFSRLSRLMAGAARNVPDHPPESSPSLFPRQGGEIQTICEFVQGLRMYKHTELLYKSAGIQSTFSTKLISTVG